VNAQIGGGGGGGAGGSAASAGGGGDRIGAVFGALSDPTRRTILDHLAQRDAATATEIAAVVPMSRQAVGKHLQTLNRVGFVTPVREGREVRYRLVPEPLDEAGEWIAREGAKWDRRLSRLRAQLEAGRPDRS
jgi:DNA-binding transcriptional ArsR family regulator